DGKALATWNSNSGSDTVLVDVETGKQSVALKVPRGVALASLLFAPDGKRVVTTGSDATIRVWDPATGEERAAWSPPPPYSGPSSPVAFAPDGQSLAGAPGDPTSFLLNWKESRQGEVKLLDATTGKALPGTPASLIGHEGSVWAAAFHPGGRVLATAGQDGTTR